MPTVIMAEYQDRILVFDLRASAYADEAEWYRGSLPFVSRNRRREVFLCSKIYHRQTEGQGRGFLDLPYSKEYYEH